jgi:hypothetical protein
MKYCHVLAVKENASEIPVYINQALNGGGPAVPPSPRPSIGDANFSLDSPSGAPPPPPPARSASTRGGPAAPPQQKAPAQARPSGDYSYNAPQPTGVAPARSIKRTQGMLSHHSSLSAVGTAPTPPTQRSASVDNGDTRSWSLKFDALYLGAEAVPTADMDGIRAGIRLCEEHRKAIDVRGPPCRATCLVMRLRLSEHTHTLSISLSLSLSLS